MRQRWSRQLLSLTSDNQVESKPPRDDDRERPSWSKRFFGLSSPRAESEDDDQRRKKWAAAGAGMELAAGIGLFAGLGYLGDWYFGTLPWMTVIGALLGMAAGMYQLIKTIGKQ